MLALLAIAPLLGLAFLSYGRISEANRSTENLSQVQAATDDLVAIVELVRFPAFFSERHGEQMRVFPG